MRNWKVEISHLRLIENVETIPDVETQTLMLKHEIAEQSFVCRQALVCTHDVRSF